MQEEISDRYANVPIANTAEQYREMMVSNNQSDMLQFGLIEANRFFKVTSFINYFLLLLDSLISIECKYSIVCCCCRRLHGCGYQCSSMESCRVATTWFIR